VLDRREIAVIVAMAPGGATDWLLLILFVDLQLADVVSTNYGPSPLPGVWEAKPR